MWFVVKRGNGVVADLGLRMKAIDVPVGLAIGVACQLVMVPVLYWGLFKIIGVKDVSAAARDLTDRATDPFSILLVFVVVAVGAPLAEEIYFRGFAQRIFGRKLIPPLAILASATFFAASHVAAAPVPGSARVRSDPRHAGLALRPSRAVDLGPRRVQRRHRGHPGLPSRVTRDCRPQMTTRRPHTVPPWGGHDR